MMAVVTFFFLLLAEPIVRIFSHDELVVRHGTEALRIIGSGYIFYGIGMVMTQALNGAGDTKTPTWINFFCFWILQIPLAYFLTIGLDWNAKGAIAVIPISHATLAAIAWFYFQKGKWKELQV